MGLGWGLGRSIRGGTAGAGGRAGLGLVDGGPGLGRMLGDDSALPAQLPAGPGPLARQGRPRQVSPTHRARPTNGSTHTFFVTPYTTF